MDLVLDLQAMDAPAAMEGHEGGGHGGGHGGAQSNLSLLAACSNSTLSLLAC
jgi:Lanthionine-containing peptide SapB precursor RamS